jgi:hypothetical protein
MSPHRPFVMAGMIAERVDEQVFHVLKSDWLLCALHVLNLIRQGRIRTWPRLSLS